MMRTLATFQGHEKDAICAAWHPCHEDLFASGAYDGTILFWLVSHPSGPQVRRARPACPVQADAVVRTSGAGSPTLVGFKDVQGWKASGDLL